MFGSSVFMVVTSVHVWCKYVHGGNFMFGASMCMVVTSGLVQVCAWW